MTTPTWLDRHFTIPCTIYTRVEAGKDEYGNVSYAEGPPTDTTCYIQPASQEEIQDGRAEVGQYLVHLRASMVGLLDGFARIEVNGVSYEVAAPPAFYPSLTRSGVHHVEVSVQRGSADEE